ncbi:hypothetical protein VUR80DRAFT_3163 [Thermomyces stellatus]
MGGTGHRLASTTIAVAGVAALLSALLSSVSIFLQAKNYRKPLLQRYVVRILLMVPLYAVASWTSMVSIEASHFLDPIRDIYEAFTIYTFTQLMINYIGGERALIIMMHGRAPVSHLWPLNHVLPKVDISDPYTFLAIKRGILQYTWLKPILALATVIMKLCGVYQEGYIGLSSGYFWSGIIYNISVTVSLYALGLFWVCMHDDLKPFRPMPKFLSIKLIIFASYWQGFFLSILVWLGAIPDDVQGYTPDNLAAAIQDALICIEMPAFAMAHWYAFSWKDFANNNIQSARMPLGHAFRDAFGPKDLIEDSKQTFMGEGYGYRVFDSGDKIIAHEDSKSRLARLKEGMRYERGGKGKYWIPKPGQAQASATTPLLGPGYAGSSSRNTAPPSHGGFESAGTFDEEIGLDPDDERLYDKARELEYGDWNYPVITANEPLHMRYHTPRLIYSQSPRPRPSSVSNQGHISVTGEGTPVTKKKKKRAPRPKKDSPADDSSSTPVGSEAHTTMIPPPAEHREDTATIGTRQENQRLLSQHEEDEGEEHERRISPSYQVDEEADEFRNVWG